MPLMRYVSKCIPKQMHLQPLPENFGTERQVSEVVPGHRTGHGERQTAERAATMSYPTPKLVPTPLPTCSSFSSHSHAPISASAWRKVVGRPFLETWQWQKTPISKLTPSADYKCPPWRNVLNGRNCPTNQPTVLRNDAGARLCRDLRTHVFISFSLLT